MKNEEISEEILKMIEEHGLTDESLTFEVEEGCDDGEYSTTDVAMFVESHKGTTILQYKDHRYRKAYKTRNGTRWNCSSSKYCSAFVYLNDNDEIIMTKQEHNHPSPVTESVVDLDGNDTAVVITSRKGKEMLLFRQYTYRKQYNKHNRSRWVCSTLKNCRACVFTDTNNFITSICEAHCHDPPKYYLKPKHVLDAMREPVILETD